MRNGFTLVELAIVITIIGLLIGGVLKGQELLGNSRLTSAAAQFRSIDAAVMTFRDTYRAKPGDIVSPGSFVPDCNTAPCNVAGNGDGHIGVLNAAISGDENNRFWLHLAKAKLISGVDINSTWSPTTLYAASMPESPLGGKLAITTYIQPPGVFFTDGLDGAYYDPIKSINAGADPDMVVPNKVTAKLDLKIDDGKPWTGKVVVLSSSCGIASGALAYDPNNTQSCYPGIRTGF